MAAMGETVAGMVHAVKNILGGLKGGIFVFEKGLELKREDLMSQGWDVVKRNIGKIQELVMDLLNYAGKRQPQLEKCDPNEVAMDVVEMMKDKANEYEVEIKFERGNFSYTPLLDRKAIHRCLANLVANAIDACSELISVGRKGKVVMKTYEGLSREICFDVSDNGCGMEEEIRRKIFNSFFTTKGSKGTGLGLMLTNKMVMEQGGRIEVYSKPQEGSKFSIILPPVIESSIQLKGVMDESTRSEREVVYDIL
jgi:signal transduction histidine kinase